jgi:hypothetical protein
MRITPVAVSLLLVVGLAGCSDSGASTNLAAAPSNSVPSVSPIPTPTAGEDLELSGPYPAGELLFTITATAHNGKAVAEFREEVYAPVEYSQVDKELQRQVKKQRCFDRYDSTYPIAYTRAYVSMTDTSPEGVSWPSEAWKHAVVDIGS